MLQHRLLQKVSSLIMLTPFPKWRLMSHLLRWLWWVGFGPFYTLVVPSMNDNWSVPSLETLLASSMIPQYPSFSLVSQCTNSLKCCFSFNWSLRVRIHQDLTQILISLLHIPYFPTPRPFSPPVPATLAFITLWGLNKCWHWLELGALSIWLLSPTCLQNFFVVNSTSQLFGFGVKGSRL